MKKHESNLLLVPVQYFKKCYESLCLHHVETSQLIDRANHLNGLYVLETLIEALVISKASQHDLKHF